MTDPKLNDVKFEEELIYTMFFSWDEIFEKEWIASDLPKIKGLAEKFKKGLPYCFRFKSKISKDSSPIFDVKKVMDIFILKSFKGKIKGGK